MTAINEKKAAALDQQDELLKSAIDFIDMVSGGASSGFSDVVDKSKKPSLSASTNTPDENRQRAMLLQELVTTDPIISKFPTHQTVNAYQQLIRIAPELSSEKEVARSVLRLSGATQAMDPFQAEQLIKANTNLFKQHMLQKGLNPGERKESE
jgi:hypothetical protein